MKNINVICTCDNATRIFVKKSDIINGDLWRLFPVINVDRVKDIPCDYPGAMGVPVTFMDKIQRNDGESGFLMIDRAKPKVNGRQKYQRLIIRNLKPKLPDEIDIVEWLNKTNSEYTVSGLVVCKNERSEKRESGMHSDGGIVRHKRTYQD